MRATIWPEAAIPHSVFFAGQLAFSDEVGGFISRFLHNHTASEPLRWLQLHGLSR